MNSGFNLPLELEPASFITPSATGSFEFAEPGDGVAALLLQVWGLDGELLDVVAWAWGAPSPWWLRRRAISYLGEAEIERHRTRYPRRPIRLVSTPRSWLRDGGHAVCIVDWSAPILPLLEEVGEVVCETAALECRLRSVIDHATSRRIKIGSAA